MELIWRNRLQWPEVRWPDGSWIADTIVIRHASAHGCHDDLRHRAELRFCCFPGPIEAPQSPLEPMALRDFSGAIIGSRIKGAISALAAERGHQLRALAASGLGTAAR